MCCVVCMCVDHECECAGICEDVIVGHWASSSKDLCLAALRHGLSPSLKVVLSTRLFGLPVNS